MIPHYSNQRLHASRAEAQFFDQLQALASTAQEPFANRSSFLIRRRFAKQFGKVLRFCLQQVIERPEIVWHPRQDLLFGQSLGQ